VAGRKKPWPILKYPTAILVKGQREITKISFLISPEPKSEGLLLKRLTYWLLLSLKIFRYMI
jgi:hypothetical protein